MARIRINQKTIKQKLDDWETGKGTEDELIFYGNEIEQETIKLLAWDKSNMIIDIVPDVVQGFNKIVFKEKL